MDSNSVKKGGQLTLGMMILYSLASIGGNALDSIFEVFGAVLYIEHGYIVKWPILFGIAVFFGRVIDALSNPVVGYWSDTDYGPRGRRIPYILKGTIPMTIFFIMFFKPLGFLKGDIQNFVYAAICCGGMLFFFTYVFAPYLALMPAIARSNDDRVKISSYVSIATILGIVLGFVASGIVVNMFLGPEKKASAYSIMAVIFGVFSLITIYATAFTVKEKPIKKEDRVKLNFWGSVLPSFRNRHFILYVVSISSFWVGFKVLQTSINFVCMKMFGKGETYGAVAGMGGMIAVWLIATPFVFFVQKKLGKKKVFGGALLIIAIVSFLQGFMGMIPKELGLFYYLGTIFCLGVPFSALLVLYNAVLGDIIDLDEKTTGARREAMYYGMEGLFTKTARGLGAIMIMVLFQVFGKPTMDNHTALIFSGPVCGLFAFIGFLVFSRYPIKD